LLTVTALAVAVSGCADNASTLTLNQALMKESLADLSKEKPVVAVCAALRLIAKDPASVGVQDVRDGRASIRMGVQGAANWLVLSGDVQTRAGSDWMKSSRASAMMFRDWLLFSQPIMEHLHQSTSVSTPDMNAVTKALRSIQSACTTVYGTSKYTLVK
jgi:hypothetical protein